MISRLDWVRSKTYIYTDFDKSAQAAMTFVAGNVSAELLQTGTADDLFWPYRAMRTLSIGQSLEPRK